MQGQLFAKHAMSISYNEDEILSNILSLHVPSQKIDMDPTYSKGVIYKGKIQAPQLKFDINPQVEGCRKADCTALPIPSKSLDCILFDPPFVISNEHNPDSKIINRFTCFKTWFELVEMYKLSLHEFHRVLKRNGVVIFKCQDVLNGGNQYFSHLAVMMLANEIGYYWRDLFILLKKNRLQDHTKNQRHARKHHSYYIVLEKRRRQNFLI